MEMIAAIAAGFIFCLSAIVLVIIFAVVVESQTKADAKKYYLEGWHDGKRNIDPRF